MPGIARKVLVCAAIDGLIVQPLSSKNQRPYEPLRIKYGDAAVASVAREHVPDTSQPDSSFEAFGIVGLITVSRLSYLVTITRRQQVAQICGHPIYVVTEVAVTPCTSHASAAESVRRTALHLSRKAQESDDEDLSSDDEVEIPSRASDEVDDAVVESRDGRPESGMRSSVAEDVIRRRGSYGRFAQRWFSRSGWTQDQKRNMGLSHAPAVLEEDAVASEESSAAPTPGEQPALPTNEPELLPKLLRTVQVLFGSSQSFYFSYDFDITRSLSKKDAPVNPETPLHTQAESIFFWNRNLMKPFLESGHDSVALPLMQGFIGQRTFVVDSQPPQKDDGGAQDAVELSTLSPSRSNPGSPAPEDYRQSIDLRPTERKYLITLISRRSTKRAGLRYHRRGVDEDGFVANMVETEQLLSSPTWDGSKIYSILQIRGSIPLFFTQSPYSLKPVPILQHSPEANFNACRRHFERLSRNYGELQIVNLVEKKGVEKAIGVAFETNVEKLNQELGDDSKIPFEWFDFHHACKGMKFENVSYLLVRLREKLEELGSTVQENGKQVAWQKGVLRTNCMDCLDRTNVCQSSFGKHMLELQLKNEGIDVSAQLDQETTWFNTLWADNGDAVSKQYSSTSAMKGDYTRTRKRDYRGALNDLGLSLTRYYSGMVNDFFSQAAIDFLLGNVTANVFEEFESDMMTKDPAMSVIKMREQAIELCQKRVIADDKEEFHGGWVLLSPTTPDTIKPWPMEEVVLLLTDAALYLCKVDWKLDKVSSFERIELGSVTHMRLGTYITSTVSFSHIDESRNVGFVVSYQPGKTDIKRTNTRTFSSLEDTSTQDAKAADAKDASIPTTLASLLAGRSTQEPGERRLVFKAPYRDSSMAVAGDGPHQTETQLVETICDEIQRLALEHQVRKPGEEEPSLIERKDIISLDEARRNTGMLEQLGHSLKKFVWA